MVACAIVVVSVRMKSSAVSVSSAPGLEGRDSAPSSPSGLPVLKKNGAAQAGAASHTPTLIATPTTLDRNTVRTALFISLLLSVGKSDHARMAAGQSASDVEELEENNTSTRRRVLTSGTYATQPPKKGLLARRRDRVAVLTASGRADVGWATGDSLAPRANEAHSTCRRPAGREIYVTSRTSSGGTGPSAPHRLGSVRIRSGRNPVPIGPPQLRSGI
jgi:hypothetical protein